MRLLLALAACLLLSGCAGGSGGNSQPAPSNPPATESLPLGPARKGLLYGYFASDDQQVADTADHTNVIHIPSAGNEWRPADKYQSIIATAVNRLALAKATGIDKAILTMDFCGFDGNGYLGSTEARNRIERYLDQVDRSQLIALYTFDEGTDADAMQRFCDDLRHVCNLPLATIYGDGHGRNYPALEDHDWAGRDAYGEGAGALGEPYDDFRSRMRSEQRTIIVPPCANPPDGDRAPWRVDPRAWFDFAVAHEEVIWLAPFNWSGYDGSTTNGLRSNPALQPAYRAIGMAIKEQSE